MELGQTPSQNKTDDTRYGVDQFYANINALSEDRHGQYWLHKGMGNEAMEYLKAFSSQYKPDTNDSDYRTHFNTVQAKLDSLTHRSKRIKADFETVARPYDSNQDGPIYVASKSYRKEIRNGTREFRSVSGDPSTSVDKESRKVSFDSHAYVSLMPYTEKDYYVATKSGEFVDRNPAERSLPEASLVGKIKFLKDEIQNPVKDPSEYTQRRNQSAKEIKNLESQIKKKETQIEKNNKSLSSLEYYKSVSQSLDGPLIGGFFKKIAVRILLGSLDSINEKILACSRDNELQGEYIKNLRETLLQKQGAYAAMDASPRTLEEMQQDLRKYKAELVGYSKEAGVGVMVSLPEKDGEWTKHVAAGRVDGVEVCYNSVVRERAEARRVTVVAVEEVAHVRQQSLIQGSNQALAEQTKPKSCLKTKSAYKG